LRSTTAYQRVFSIESDAFDGLLESFDLALETDGKSDKT
jgi:hypothetical protein